MIKRANQTRQELDKHRFRFRVRFERPAGGGSWNLEATLFAWLDARLGKGNYIFHGDRWEGHGTECYALQFDDHAIIPDLLTHYHGIRAEINRRPDFRAVITRERAREARMAIAALQSRLVDKINCTFVSVIWSMGRCEVLPGETLSEGGRVFVARIKSLSQIDAQLSVPNDEGHIEIVLTDEQRADLELGLAILGDIRPIPSDEIAPLRSITDALEEIK